MPSPALLELLQRVAAGTLDPQGAALHLDPAAMASIEGATVDLGRRARCGFGEVIYGEGKPASLVLEIARRLLEVQPEVLVTRCDEALADTLAKTFPHHHHSPRGRTVRLATIPLWDVAIGGETGGSVVAAEDQEVAPSDVEETAGPQVAVVTAGSTDGPVAEEAAQTLAWMRVAVDRIEDIGVAGPQRLLAAVPRLRRSDAIVVAAGMEGTLPSVVAGHVDCPVVAVPTSVGYGAALQGWAALLAMLSSCAANVAVVNIDAGFKAGYLAGMIAWGARGR